MRKQRVAFHCVSPTGCCALLLPLFFGLDGVLCSMPVSDALTFIISVIAIVHTRRALKAAPVNA